MQKIISTPCGDIKGTVSDGIIDFKGIRYANCRRWTYPEIVTEWNGVYDASEYGNCSYQPRAFYNEEENPAKIFYYNEFRNVPDEILFREWKKVKGSGLSAVPVKDGILIKDKPTVKNIPYMVGSTSHDMAPAVLYLMTRNWAKKNGAYMWMFERMLPGDDKGAWHSSDLWYWFGTLKNCWRPMEEADYKLSDEMSTYLCNFVKKGNPNGENLPEWKKCRNDKDVISFSNGISSKGKMKMLIYNTLTNKPVGE